MVRIKYRYLLVELLYPSKLPAQASTTTEQPSTLLIPSNQTPTTVALHAPTHDSIKIGDLIHLIRLNVSQFFGDHGSAAVGAGLQIKYWSNATSTLIIRCRREAYRILWATLTFIKNFDGVRSAKGHNGPSIPGSDREKSVVFRVVRVSGTIRKCEDELLRRARGFIGRVKGVHATEMAGLNVQKVVGGQRGTDLDATMAIEPRLTAEAATDVPELEMTDARALGIDDESDEEDAG